MEFELIKKYFAAHAFHRPDVICGIGDDAAIVSVPRQHQLVMTTDTLIAGIHFRDSALPFDIGHKLLAVNLSDLAAMGATPTWVTLAITLPEVDEAWLQAFCAGFFTLADRFDVQLIGGDLTRGALSLTVQATGLIPTGQAVLRSRAMPTDLIYVTGSLGDAGLALKILQKQMALSVSDRQFILERLDRPCPRIEAGIQLRDLAHAAIDISDGLAADLSHILEQSQVGAALYVDSLPLSAALQRAVSKEEAISLALTSGDDYELCFTVPKEKQHELEKKLSSIACRYTCIGTINQAGGLTLRYQNGNIYHGPINGYQHF